jgi:transposase
MMGRLKSDQGQLFYEFRLGDAVPEDHMVRKIDTALDLSWLRSELAPHYSSMGRPSIDPELMMRMLVVGYVFAIRSERLICREVQVTLPLTWAGLPPADRTQLAAGALIRSPRRCGRAAGPTPRA